MKKIDDYNDAKYDPKVTFPYDDNNTLGRRAVFVQLSDSMEPIIPKGSIIRSIEVQRNCYRTGLPLSHAGYYVIYTVHAKNPLVKQIRLHNIEEGYIICHSLSEESRHNDFKLNLNDVQSLFYITEVGRSVSSIFPDEETVKKSTF